MPNLVFLKLFPQSLQSCNSVCWRHVAVCMSACGFISTQFILPEIEACYEMFAISTTQDHGGNVIGHICSVIRCLQFWQSWPGLVSHVTRAQIPINSNGLHLSRMKQKRKGRVHSNAKSVAWIWGNSSY